MIVEMKRPKFSVIIPALNEESYIENVLACLSSQTFTDYEVIVVLDPDTVDGTAQIAEKCGAEVIRCPVRGICSARDYGAENSRGEILVFTDSDVRIPADWLEKINRPFKDDKLVALSGSSMPFDGNVILKMEYIAWNLVRSIFNHAKRFFNPGYFVAIRREIYQQTGGFADPDHPYLDLKHQHDDRLTNILPHLGETKISLSNWAFPSSRRYRKLGILKFNLYYFYMLENVFFYGKKLPKWWISLQKHIAKLVTANGR